MAYSPGQPWDNSLSYTTGQTCTYNGFPYVWYHPVLSSTVGAKPNEEEVMFEAYYLGNTDQRLERGWVMADTVESIGSDIGGARYGDVKRLQAAIRGVDPAAAATSYITQDIRYENGIYPAFWTTQIGNKSEYSWEYYGYGSMSVHHGLANNDLSPTVPETDGNPNVQVLGQNGLETLGPQLLLPSLPYQIFQSTGPTTGDIQVYFVIAHQDYSPSFINEFNRNASYTITVTPPSGPVYTINGVINSGPFRDGFSLQSTSNMNVHSVSTGPGFSYQFKVTGLTPRFDA